MRTDQKLGAFILLVGLLLFCILFLPGRKVKSENSENIAHMQSKSMHKAILLYMFIVHLFSNHQRLNVTQIEANSLARKSQGSEGSPTGKPFAVACLCFSFMQNLTQIEIGFRLGWMSLPGPNLRLLTLPFLCHSHFKAFKQCSTVCNPQVNRSALGNGSRQIHILITPLIGYAAIQIKDRDSNSLRINKTSDSK